MPAYFKTRMYVRTFVCDDPGFFRNQLDNTIICWAPVLTLLHDDVFIFEGVKDSN